MLLLQRQENHMDQIPDEQVYPVELPDVRYFVLPQSLGFSRRLKNKSKETIFLPDEIKQLASTYGTTLGRMNTAALLPYRMAWLGVLDVQIQSFEQRALFQAVAQVEDDFDNLVPPLREKLAAEMFANFMASDKGIDAAHRGAIHRLHRSTQLDEGSILRGAQDLLLQSAISVWAAFETFVSDFIRCYLNQCPQALHLLLADEDAKKRIGRAKWTLTDLLAIGLNLSDRVGDLVLTENDLSDLVSMKALLLPLFERDEQLRMSLAEPDLFILGKLRNILAHRGGAVDTKFEKETTGRWRAGETVTIEVADLNRYLNATVATVEQILTSANRKFENSRVL